MSAPSSGSATSSERSLNQHEGSLSSFGYGTSLQASVTVKDIPRLEELHRELTVDNLRLWECVNVMRCNPRLPAKKVLNDVFALTDDEFFRHYSAYADFEQTGNGALSNLSETGGCHGQRYLQHVQTHNSRLVTENGRLLTVMHILGSEPARCADEVVCGTFAMSDRTFASKFPVLATYERVLADLGRLKDESRAGRHRSFTRSPSIFKSPLFHNSRRHSSPPSSYGPSTSNNNEQALAGDRVSTHGMVKLPRFDTGEQFENRPRMLLTPMDSLSLNGSKGAARTTYGETASPGNPIRISPREYNLRSSSPRELPLRTSLGRESSFTFKFGPRPTALRAIPKESSSTPLKWNVRNNQKVSPSSPPRPVSLSPKLSRGSGCDRRSAFLCPRSPSNTLSDTASRSPDYYYLKNLASSNNTAIPGADRNSGPSRHDNVEFQEEDDEEDSVPYLKHSERMRTYKSNGFAVMGMGMEAQERKEMGPSSKADCETAYINTSKDASPKRCSARRSPSRRQDSNLRHTLVTGEGTAEAETPAEISAERDFNENRENTRESNKWTPNGHSVLACAVDSHPPLSSPPRRSHVEKKSSKSVRFRRSDCSFSGTGKSGTKRSTSKSSLHHRPSGSEEHMNEDKPKPMYYKPKVSEVSCSSDSETEQWGTFRVPRDDLDRSRSYLDLGSRYPPFEVSVHAEPQKQGQCFPPVQFWDTLEYEDHFNKRLRRIEESRRELMELKKTLNQYNALSDGRRLSESEINRQKSALLIEGKQCASLGRTVLPRTERGSSDTALQLYRSTPGRLHITANSPPPDSRACSEVKRHRSCTPRGQGLPPRHLSTSTKEKTVDMSKSKRSLEEESMPRKLSPEAVVVSKSFPDIPLSKKSLPSISASRGSNNVSPVLRLRSQPSVSQKSPVVKQNRYRMTGTSPKFARTSDSFLKKSAHEPGESSLSGGLANKAMAPDTKGMVSPSKSKLKKDRPHGISINSWRPNSPNKRTTPADTRNNPNKPTLKLSKKSLKTEHQITSETQQASERQRVRQDSPGSQCARTLSRCSVVRDKRELYHYAIPSDKSVCGWETRPYGRLFGSEGSLNDQLGISTGLGTEITELGERVSKLHSRCSTWPLHHGLSERGEASGSLEHLRQEVGRTTSSKDSLHRLVDLPDYPHCTECSDNGCSSGTSHSVSRSSRQQCISGERFKWIDNCPSTERSMSGSRSSSHESFDRDSLEQDEVNDKKEEKTERNANRQAKERKGLSGGDVGSGRDLNFNESSTRCLQDPPVLILGEVAFQLERCILRQVFEKNQVKSPTDSPTETDTRSRDMPVNGQRHRFYGYTVSNIQEKIRRECRDEETGKRNALKEAQLLRRYRKTMALLKYFGYTVDKHSKLAQDIINRYGLFYQPPDAVMIARYRLHEFRSVQNHVVKLSNPKEREGMLVLANCLHALRQEEQKPILSFD